MHVQYISILFVKHDMSNYNKVMELNKCEIAETENTFGPCIGLNCQNNDAEVS